jgi:hypothetical protein
MVERRDHNPQVGGSSPPSVTLGVSLASNRHERGWPHYSLHITTALSDQSYRWQLEAQGGVDSHDARGNSWEIMKWVRKWRPKTSSRLR